LGGGGGFGRIHLHEWEMQSRRAPASQRCGGLLC
jgi:hypothetical protein